MDFGLSVQPAGVCPELAGPSLYWGVPGLLVQRISTRHSISHQILGLEGKTRLPWNAPYRTTQRSPQNLPHCTPRQAALLFFTALAHNGLQGVCFTSDPLIRFETCKDGDCIPSTMPRPRRSSINADLIL